VSYVGDKTAGVEILLFFEKKNDDESILGKATHFNFMPRTAFTVKLFTAVINYVGQ
jgi:hypothetical protein